MSRITVIPQMSEKAYATSLGHVYVFKVPVSANKQQIATEVETHYGVTVVDVRTLIAKGKTVNFSRGRRRMPGSTTRKDAKKAYVTLAEGDSIKIFDEPKQEAETTAKKEEKK